MGLQNSERLGEQKLITAKALDRQTYDMHAQHAETVMV
jgi:hypothetical protein